MKAISFILILCVLFLSDAHANNELKCTTLEKEIFIDFDLQHPSSFNAVIHDLKSEKEIAGLFSTAGYYTDKEGLFVYARFNAKNIKCSPEIVLRREGSLYSGYFHFTILSNPKNCPLSGISEKFSCL